MKIGMVLGRFQIFHNGHLRYLLMSREYCDHILVGITNPDPIRIKKTDVAPHRNKSLSNPLTYYERMGMIQEVCKEMNISKDEYDIVPIPLDMPEYIRYYVPDNVLVMVTIHDEWSLEKKKRLENQGYEVKVVINEYNQKKLSSTEIRKFIAEDKEYSHYIPASVYSYLLDNQLDKKIRKVLKNPCEL